MNFLAIDYGTKRIGLAYSVSGVISTLPPVSNNSELIANLKKVIANYHIDKVYIGVSEGDFADITRLFVDKLRPLLSIDIETVEESVSTIEADAIYKANRNKAKNYKQTIDSIAAAVILRRVL